MGHGLPQHDEGLPPDCGQSKIDGEDSERLLAENEKKWMRDELEGERMLDREGYGCKQ